MTSTTLTFIAYGIALLGIAIYAARQPMKETADIHLGGRGLGVWTSALSSSASTESGFVLLGMVGMGYSVGANALWIVPAGIIGYCINWLMVGKNIRVKSESLGAVTVPEFIGKSTGSTKISKLAAALASVLAFVFLAAYVSAQFAAAGKALSAQFTITHFAGVLIGAGIVLVYSVLGGFRAVTWTDNLQAIMMVISLVVLPIAVVNSVGGWNEVVRALNNIDPNLTDIYAGQVGVGALMAALPWLMLGLAYPGQPHAVARLMAIKRTNVFGTAATISVVWFVLIYTGAVVLGMAARAGFTGLESIAMDPERILPILAIEFLPELLSGVVLAAILAAICSTADSVLLSAATTIVRDVRGAFSSTEITQEGFWTRVIIILVVAVSIFFATGEDSIVFTIVLYAWSGLGASLGPVVLYCSLIEKPLPTPALLGLIVGGLSAFYFQAHSLNLLIGFSLSAAMIFVAHLFIRSALPKNS